MLQDAALGLMEEADYASVEEPFTEGNRLALFTDGLFEAADAHGEEFGSDRLIEAFERRSRLSLGETLESVLGDVSQFCLNRFVDDVCLVAGELSNERADVPEASPGQPDPEP